MDTCLPAKRFFRHDSSHEFFSYPGGVVEFPSFDSINEIIPFLS